MHSLFIGIFVPFSDFDGVAETTTPTYDCTGKDNGLYPDPDDCHNFFECSNENSLFFHCPDGLAFNDAAHACDYEANVPSCNP